jgi:hypothetical protein
MIKRRVFACVGHPTTVPVGVFAVAIIIAFEIQGKAWSWVCVAAVAAVFGFRKRV